MTTPTRPTHIIPADANCALVVTAMLTVPWSPERDTAIVITSKTTDKDGNLLAVCDVALDGDLVSALVPYHLLVLAPRLQTRKLAIYRAYEQETAAIWRDGRLNDHTRPAALHAALVRRKARIAELVKVAGNVVELADSAVEAHRIAEAVASAPEDAGLDTDTPLADAQQSVDVAFDDVLADRHLRAVAPCWWDEDGNVCVRSNSDREKVYTVRMFGGVAVGCDCLARGVCRHRRLADHCGRWWKAAQALIENDWTPEMVAAGYLNTARLFFDAAKVGERNDAMIRAAFRMIDCAGHWLPPEVLAWTGPTPTDAQAEAGRKRRRTPVEVPLAVSV